MCIRDSYHLALNYPKRVSVKTADLLLGEPPKWDAGEKTKELDAIAARSTIVSTLRELALDISMCGDGLLYDRRTDKGGVIDIAAPVSYTHLDVYKRQHHPGSAGRSGTESL